MAAPKTPPRTPIQRDTFVLAVIGIVSQYVPINGDAKSGIVQIVSIIGGGGLAVDAGIRVGRAKFLGELLFRDTDGDPSTPPVFTGWLIVALALACALAIGLLAALLVVLL